MSMVTLMKWITGGIEAFFAIPFVGGIYIISSAWVALGVMLALHLVTLVLSIKNGAVSVGSIFGILASVLGVIPVVGWFLHILTAIILIVDASLSTLKSKKE
ncbi:hypothetical protein RZN22_03290 [Bacillaceae bacterium S4-13-58]